MNFKNFLEISINQEAPEIKGKKPLSFRSSKLLPTYEKTRIIPIKIQYDVYDILSKYAYKFPLASGLLNRRGDSIEDVILRASNEEIFNLKELADYVTNNSDNAKEKIAANMLINLIKSQTVI
jgi:hypothetical protein